MQRATTGIVYLWGENERLKAYNFDFATKRIITFRGEGTQFASGNMPAPGGMPGGRLVVSSNGNTVGTGVIWGVYPTQGNANSNVVHGALVAYDATGGEQRQAEAALSQRREPRERHGELRQVRDAGRGQRQGLRRDVQQQGRAVRALTMKKILAITAVALDVVSVRAGHRPGAGGSAGDGPRRAAACRARGRERSRQRRRPEGPGRDDVRVSEGRLECRRA